MLTHIYPCLAVMLSVALAPASGPSDEDVFGLMTNHSPENGMQEDIPAALAWTRRAAEKAVPGSEVWTKAQFSLAHAAYTLQSKPAEARSILQQIAANANG